MKAHRTIETPYGRMTRRQADAVNALHLFLEGEIKISRAAGIGHPYSLVTFEVTVPPADAYLDPYQAHTVSVYARIGIPGSAFQRDIYHIHFGVRGTPRSFRDNGKAITSPWFFSHRQMAM